MATTLANINSEYALGYTNAEHERLIRQATLIAPVTERVFREAGIGPGQRVFDVGSGMGDVTMLVARLVGPSGEVVGVERDPISIARAKERSAAAGMHNVSFIQGDVGEIESDKVFDAAVGRYILMFVPDPVAVLRDVCRVVRPGGVLAFQDALWVPMLAVGARLPLWSAVLGAIHTTFLRSGVNPEMGFALYRAFQEIGLPAPTMHLDMPLTADSNLIRNITDLMGSLRPLAELHGVPLDELGDFATLQGRVHAEVTATNTVVGVVPIVSAWSRKPVVA